MSGAPALPAPPIEPAPEAPPSVASRRWARLIQKVYEVDPLVCPDCGRAMKVVSFVTEDDVVYRILAHLGLLEPDPPPHPPPREDLEAALVEVASEDEEDPRGLQDRLRRPELSAASRRPSMLVGGAVMAPFARKGKGTYTGCVPWHVGYGEELRAARAFLRTHPVVLIEGLGGIGKSAFLAQLAPERGAIRLAAGSCWRLATLAAAIAPQLHSPDALPRPAAFSSATASRGAQRETAVAIAEWIERTHSFVLLDDLDHVLGADVLLRVLLDTLRRGRLVATARRQLVPDLLEVPRVRLRGLDERAARRLVEEVMRAAGNRKPSAGLVESVVREGKGHPLLLLACCGERAREPASPPGRAGSLRAIFSRIAGRLPAPSRELLLLFAPIRTPLPESAIAEIAGPSLAPELRELSRRFLIECDAEGRVLVPAAIAEAARAPAGRDAEERAARVGSVLSRLAAEGKDAALSVDALRHLIAGGRAAEAKDFLSRAATWLGRAGFGETILALAAEIESALGRPDPQLRLLRAEAAIDLCRFAEARRALEGVVPPEALVPSFELARGRVAEELGEAESRFRLAAEGFLRAGEKARAAEALAARGQVLARIGQFDAGRAAAEQALACASESGSPRARGMALSVMAKLLHERSDFEGAARVAEEAASAFEAAGRPGLALPALETLADALTNLGESERAHAAIRRGLAIARNLGAHAQEVRLLRTEAEIDLFEGAAEAAVKRLDCALALAARLGEARLSIALEMTSGEAALETNDFARAERHFRAALASYTAQGNVLAALGARFGLARALAGLGKSAAAEDLFSHCLRVVRENALSLKLPDLLLGRAACRAKLGRFEAAREDCEEAVRCLGEINPGRADIARVPLAAILVRLGERDAAIRMLEGILLRASAGRPALLAARVLEEATAGGRCDGPAADELLAAPATDRNRALELLRMGSPALPQSFLIVTNAGERPADLFAALEARGNVEEFDILADGLERRVFVRAKGSFLSFASRPRLFSLLACLMRASGRPLGPHEIAASAWGIRGYVICALRNLVRANVHRLRRALGPPRAIETLPGPAGYRLSPGLRFLLVERLRDRICARLAPATRHVLEVMEAHGPLSARALATRMRLPSGDVERELERLAEAGLCAVRIAGGEKLYVPLPS